MHSQDVYRYSLSCIPICDFSTQLRIQYIHTLSLSRVRSLSLARARALSLSLSLSHTAHIHTLRPARAPGHRAAILHAALEFGLPSDAVSRLCLCPYLCTYGCVYIRTLCVYTYMHASCTHTYLCTYVCICIHMGVYTYMHTYIPVYICECMHTCVCIYMHMRVCTYICTYIHTYIHT